MCPKTDADIFFVPELVTFLDPAHHHFELFCLYRTHHCLASETATALCVLTGKEMAKVHFFSFHFTACSNAEAFLDCAAGFHFWHDISSFLVCYFRFYFCFRRWRRIFFRILLKAAALLIHLSSYFLDFRFVGYEHRNHVPAFHFARKFDGA